MQLRPPGLLLLGGWTPEGVGLQREQSLAQGPGPSCWTLALLAPRAPSPGVVPLLHLLLLLPRLHLHSITLTPLALHHHTEEERGQ